MLVWQSLKGQNTAPSAHANKPIQTSVFFACHAANLNRVTSPIQLSPCNSSGSAYKKGRAGNKLTNNSLLWLEISFLRTNRRSRVNCREHSTLTACILRARLQLLNFSLAYRPAGDTLPPNGRRRTEISTGGTRRSVSTNKW